MVLRCLVALEWKVVSCHKLAFTVRRMLLGLQQQRDDERRQKGGGTQGFLEDLQEIIAWKTRA